MVFRTELYKKAANGMIIVVIETIYEKTQKFLKKMPLSAYDTTE